MTSTPAIVHRFTVPIRDAIEALLGDAVGDAEAWQVRVDGDQLVVDIVGPAAEGMSYLPQSISAAVVAGDTVSNETAINDAADVVHIRDERLKREGVEKYFVEDGSPHDRMVDEAFAKVEEPEVKGGPLAARPGAPQR